MHVALPAELPLIKTSLVPEKENKKEVKRDGGRLRPNQEGLVSRPTQNLPQIPVWPLASACFWQSDCSS